MVACKREAIRVSRHWPESANEDPSCEARASRAVDRVPGADQLNLQIPVGSRLFGLKDIRIRLVDDIRGGGTRNRASDSLTQTKRESDH